MTQEKITGYYKLLALVTLIVSIVVPIFLIEETIAEKVGIGLILNLQFHFAYHFLSRVPLEMYRYVEKERSELKMLTLRMFRFFSWMVIILSIFGFIGLLNIAFKEPRVLVGVMTLSAIFLGGYSSVVKFSEN
jgi:hypothetical protein